MDSRVVPLYESTTGLMEPASANAAGAQNTAIVDDNGNPVQIVANDSVPTEAANRFSLSTQSILVANNDLPGNGYTKLTALSGAEVVGGPIITGISALYAASVPMGHIGSNDRFFPQMTFTAEGLSIAATDPPIGFHGVKNLNYGLDEQNARWLPTRVASAAALAAQSALGAQLITRPGDWSISHTPGANTQATITRAAGAAGVCHVCTSLTFTLIGLTGSAETTVLATLRDGASGAGTVLWSQTLQVIPGGTTGIALSNLNIPGSAATAMTLEFAAAGGASTVESVALTGYDAPA